MGDHSTRPDQASEIAVDPLHSFLRKPMQRRSGQYGIELWLGQRVYPSRVTQIGLHNPHATVIGEGRGRDCEQHRIDIDGDRTRSRESVEEPTGDRARATSEVKHAWCRAREHIDDVEQRADPELPVGHESLFEMVPRPLPAFGPPGVVHESHKQMLGLPNVRSYLARFSTGCTRRPRTSGISLSMLGPR